MFQTIKDWYNLYGSLGEFIRHKIFHVAAGFFGAGIVAMLTQHVLAGIATAVVLGVAKEVYDHHLLLQDPTNPVDKLIYHTYDVIVTTLGGCLIILISRMW